MAFRSSLKLSDLKIISLLDSAINLQQNLCYGTFTPQFKNASPLFYKVIVTIIMLLGILKL